MKVGLFTPYVATMGGGERYMLTAAEFFLRRGDEVDIFGEGEASTSQIKDRFNLDLTGLKFVKNVFAQRGNYREKISRTRPYDLILFLSDGSIPLSFAAKNILHFQMPIPAKGVNILDWLKLRRINTVICNSYFTKKYIDESYHVQSRVIYPPVDVESFRPGVKENIILAVGRFFAPANPKKQEILIREFVDLYKNKLRGWRLVLIGGITAGSRKEIDRLRKKSTGFPIKIIADSAFPVLQEYYSKAKIFWHAAGYGENLEKYPDKAEHFGIATVEAMAAGCVPLSFAGGGQLEIIEDGKSGFLWKTPEELKEKTLNLIKDFDLWQQLSSGAVIRSGYFSKEKFFGELEKLLAL